MSHHPIYVTGSIAPQSSDPDLDPPWHHLGVFLLADKIDLGCSDVGVAGELTHLVQSTVTMHLR
jgi:hypothetical protein